MLHAFDSYKEIKNFTAAGFSEDQAQKVVHLVMETQKQSIDHLATKEDIGILRAEISGVNSSVKNLEVEFGKDIDHLDAKIDQVESSLRQEIKNVEGGLRNEIKNVENGLGNEIRNVENGLRNEIKIAAGETRHSMLMWIIPFLSANTLALIGLYAQAFFR